MKTVKPLFGALLNLMMITLLAFALNTAPVYAAAMPNGHGMFADNPRICVSCHRTHTATAGNLLRLNAGLCQTCHSGGAGADTDIASGMYVNSPTDPNNWGVVGEPLLGGGFAVIDGTSMSYPGTSQHKIGGDPSVPFGSASGASMRLTCTSCHTIHAGFYGGAQYRLLRLDVGDSPTPMNVRWNGPWEGPGQTSPNNAAGYMAYTETDFSAAVDINDPSVVRPDLINPAIGWTAMEYTRNYKAGLSAWCEACHSVYGTPDDLTGTKIRHTVEVPLVIADITGTKLHSGYGDPSSDLPLNDLSGNGRTGDDTLSCMTCHKAHGTTAIMDKMGVYAAADRTGLPPMTGSMLLRRNNRGVCVNCHHNLGGSSF